ncbi:MAG: hemerythrin domain-containing protein [Actinobacteria bacterium]|nr:hemerythrin domain-containing protein [Actinomycetota bacterium]MCB0921673.1 hemerythrin domain-containing protein [Actinomycetota bacterium]
MAVDFAMNGMMHRAFLRELDRVQGFVESGDTPAARRHYGFFSDLLHQHHEGEDTFLFALVRERSTDPDALATIDALEAEHEQLHAALDTCDDDFSGSGPLPADTVADLKALRMVLAAHCAHEEADGERVLADYVAKDDLKPFNDFNRRGDLSMLVFPWIADGGSAADQKVYDVLPGPVRLFLRPVMQRKYKAYFN